MQFTRYERANHSVYTVDMTKEHHWFSELATKSLQKARRLWQRVLIIGARKWYAWWHVCWQCGHVPMCDTCDIPIAFHAVDTPSTHLWTQDFIGLCHICKTQYPVSERCRMCAHETLEFYGYGTQQIAEFITHTYDVVPLVIDSSHVNSPKKLETMTTLLPTAQFIIWTSLLSLPPANLPIDIVVVIHGDMGLNNPNFHAPWQHFCWLYELIGAYPHSHIIVQTHLHDHPWIHAAAQQNIAMMRDVELKKRKSHHYPPFGEFCVLLYKHEIEERLFGSVHKLYQELLYLKESQQVDVTLYATPPIVYKMFGKYRYSIIVTWPQIRSFVDYAYAKLRIRSRGFKVDREPRQIL
jgi:primosomal protein N' (replication factor Y)